jgi:hypothetical protein
VRRIKRCVSHTVTAARFWSHVLESPACWIWTGNIGPNGYGRFGQRYAHRLSYEWMRGPIPEGMFVLHHCDNPPCVRPDHLFLGTAADNSHDMVRKGRWAGTRAIQRKGVVNAGT